ncbi:hypothetical protein EVAR_68851_1 [Eumeta japonica]|uniref:Uncharacterized protein n=1 Tax=Eumeta variegata TaxID=151549 RepID=A0A4C2A414_EUMVA|nr:hypothetical protein EVAR_68851_1 [Eumeta japonica]
MAVLEDCPRALPEGYTYRHHGLVALVIPKENSTTVVDAYSGCNMVVCGEVSLYDLIAYAGSRQICVCGSAKDSGAAAHQQTVLEIPGSGSHQVKA